jgi:hypothetical protein
MIQKEADEFLAACQHAARSIVRLKDPQLAHDLLVDAILVVSEYYQRMDAAIFKYETTAPDYKPPTTLGRFKR